MKKIKEISLLLIATLMISGIAIANPIKKASVDNDYPYPSMNLLKLLDNGASIMAVVPHPDDIESFTPGIIAIAKDRGNPCWVVCTGSLENVPESIRELRQIDNEWYEDNYLEEYIYLGFLMPWDGLTYKEMEQPMINLIEQKHPDIILTFTLDGFHGVGTGHHSEMPKLINRIYNRLSYHPSVYWFLNMDEGYISHGGFTKHYEYDHYPYTDVLWLDEYSENLGMTYWDAKVDVWEHYYDSVPVLYRSVIEYGLLENNCQKEYFRKAR